MNLSKHQLAVGGLIIANLIWGAAPPIFKWALTDIHPFTLAFLRFFIPALILLPLARGHLSIHKKDYSNIFLVGFFGITINIVFFFLGLMQAPSINAALIASSGPVFIILISYFFLKDKPKSKVIKGGLIGLVGVLVVLITPFLKGGNLTAIGNIYYLFSMIASVIAVLVVRKIMKRNHPMAVTFWSFLIGAAGFLPLFIGEIKEFGFLPNLTIEGMVGLTFGIFFSSLIAYYLQTFALKYVTASDVGVFTYIDPVVTILVAAPLLGEFPDGVFVIGTVLVLLGIFMAEGRFHWHPFHLFLKK